MLRVLNKEQVNSLLAVCDQRTRDGRRDRAFLASMVWGGLRIAEACNLQRSDVEFVEGRVRLMFTGKGRKTRTVTLPKAVSKTFRRLLADHDDTWLFHGHYPNKPVSLRGGYHIVVTRAREAGLPEWVHPHSLRHTYATLLLRATSDIHLVSTVLGHADIRTTVRSYIAADPRASRRAAAAMEGAF